MAVDKDEIEYHVTVTGLDETKAQTETAAQTANNATAALNATQNQATSTLRPIMTTIRTLNSAISAVKNTSRAINELNPTAALYAFMNMIQVVYSLTSLMQILQKSTAGASAAQAALATLTGRWYLIPLALAAAGLIYSRLQSYKTGGYVPETGIYQLHKGEYVVPSRSVAYNSFGPIFVTLPTESARQNYDARELVRTLGPEIMRKSRSSQP